MSRRCQFCELSVPGDTYTSHLSSVHNMVGGDGDSEQIQRRVKCMFCLSPMLESEMAGHVFFHHRISGLYLGPGTRAASSASCEDKQIQTDDNHEDDDDLGDPEHAILIPTAELCQDEDQTVTDPVNPMDTDQNEALSSVQIIADVAVEDSQERTEEVNDEDQRYLQVVENQNILIVDVRFKHHILLLQF